MDLHGKRVPSSSQRLAVAKLDAPHNFIH